MTPAERKKTQGRARAQRYRDRIKAGKRIIQLEVDDVDAAEDLVVAGELDPMSDDDPDALREAFQRLYEKWRRKA